MSESVVKRFLKNRSNTRCAGCKAPSLTKICDWCRQNRSSSKSLDIELTRQGL